MRPGGRRARTSARRSSRPLSSTLPGSTRTTSPDARRRCFTIYPVRGEYAELIPSKRSLVNALVYPLPHAAGHGMGVHITRSTAGNVWFGPTVKYQRRKDDYEGDRLPVEAVRGIGAATTADADGGRSAVVGQRHPSQAASAGQSFADFIIRRDIRNPRVIHAAGIESPGLTSCLGIGEFVSRIATS